MGSRRPRETGATSAGDAPAPSVSRHQRREVEAAAVVEDGKKKQKAETPPQSSPAIYNFNRYDKEHCFSPLLNLQCFPPLLVPSNMLFHAEDNEEYEDYIEEGDDVIVEDDYTYEELDYMSNIVVRGLIFILIALTV
jgi:hypothetical protein